jgi:lipopolysaccharide/colanic/teichoic acid biosynthesis glycosyltransferase
MIKRILDLTISIVGIIMLSPIFILLSFWIKIDSRGSVFYKQVRVGKDNHDFLLYKFRSMKIGSDKKGLITVGDKDARITKPGYFIRKYKLDELPQLFNVVKGDMSLVGPRPEVRRYVNLYTADQLRVLSVKPGITDLASIKYRNESVLLAQSANPDETYVSEIMPEKLRLNLEYINKQSFLSDIGLILLTIKTIIKER